MDTGKGYLAMLEEKEYQQVLSVGEEGARTDGLFRLNEIVEVKGSRFKIKKITPKGLTLRVLPKESSD
uniref:Uncharacterized protein n=1 Tax=viral metagenome TaxID=1070528 RepID=A0A6M3IVF7_9ZZZZ